ncbi:MAG TPA: hypothetical protein VGU69_06805 [Rhizomicrobium sp.]|nr:hypothetical protein [Rhizomicrobium sp.]
MTAPVDDAIERSFGVDVPQMIFKLTLEANALNFAEPEECMNSMTGRRSSIDKACAMSALMLSRQSTLF